MNIFSQILFFCSMIYLGLGIGILYTDRKAALNRVFFALNLSLFIWSIAVAYSIIAPDKTACSRWSMIASLGYCTFAPISLHFFLIYARKNHILKKWWAYVLLYLPAPILFFQAIKHDLFASDFIHNQYGWVPIRNVGSVWFFVFLLTIGLTGLINVYLCYFVLRKSASVRERKQAKIIFISTIISFIIAMAFSVNFVTKIFFSADIPDITVVTLLVWLSGILYAIIKFRLMILSPSLAAESILKTIIDSVILVNPKGLITYVNAETLSLLGYESTDLLGKPFEILFPEDVRSGTQNIVKTLVHDPIRNQETFFISKDNTAIPILFSASVCNDNDGNYIGFVALSRDITEYRKKEEEIKYLSYHDQLTGLYNRRFYEEELKRLDTTRNLPIAIIMGDVNGLKVVNDSLGHAKGDELLKKVAHAITKGCREGDIVARHGGDEFVVLLPKTDQAQAEAVMNRMKELLAKEKVDAMDISVSFGCHVKENERENIQDIFKDAEDRMYAYKQRNSPLSRRNTTDLAMSALYEKKS